MVKKKGKSVSFDAMVKFFMNTYRIPTRTDINRLNQRLDRLERLIVSSGRTKSRRGNKPEGSRPMTASDQVLEIVRRYQDGVGFAEIKLQTGYGSKKLRNIIYRLNKMGKIKAKSRGIYIEA
jgi:hypothetical protein